MTTTEYKALISEKAALIKGELITEKRSVWPQHTNESDADFAMIIISMMSYYIAKEIIDRDLAVQEAIDTDVMENWESVENLGKFYAYTPQSAVAATGTVTFYNNGGTTTIPSGTLLSTVGDDPIFYETDTDTFILGSTGETANITQGRTFQELHDGDATADQQVQLNQYPIIDGTVTVEVYNEKTTVWETWTEKEHFLDSGSTSHPIR